MIAITGSGHCYRLWQIYHGVMGLLLQERIDEPLEFLQGTKPPV